MLIDTIRRTNQGPFSVRGTGTEVATKRKGVKIVKIEILVGLVVGIAVCMLQRSLDKGGYRDMVQFETAGKLKSAHSNIWHASRQTLTTSVKARDLKKTNVTSCSTY